MNDLHGPAPIIEGAWPEPSPLMAKLDPEPYPLDALPDTIRAAVAEVQGFTKAPVPLVASCALGALSLATQAHADVRRADRLHGPSSLFLLTIADSGERKSTCDSFFTSAIREYEMEEAEVAKSKLQDYFASMAAWEAKQSGIKDAIRQAAKNKKPTADLEALLRDHEGKKPAPPRVPRLIRGDDTPESLAWSLAKQWPSAGVVSSEAGIVFGAHGMGKESIMRNLALLNVLWDGGTHEVGRRTSESFTVRGARLTVTLQVQPAALLEFFSRSGLLARGTGFLARFLISWPESTQGFRSFTEAPASWPALASFNSRIGELLRLNCPMDHDGALSPGLLSLSADAKAAWIAYHDIVEIKLRGGGELSDVKDVASKSADNVARLATLFHVFGGATGAIDVDSVERAARVVAWHLSESRRFFGELALPKELADAARLDAWLSKVGDVPKRDAQRLGPVRDGLELNAALKELSDCNRVRLRKEGRSEVIVRNPLLRLEGAS